MIEQIGIESKQISEMIHHSHERMDGRGYPSALKGEEIPLGARIIAVADAYSALTSNRPYRKKWEKSAALQEIERSVESGQFDANVVKQLKKIMATDEKKKSSAA